MLWQHSGGASVTQSVGHFPLSFGQKQIKFKRPRPPQRHHYQQRCVDARAVKLYANWVPPVARMRVWRRPTLDQPPAFASKLKSLFSKDYYSRLQYRIWILRTHTHTSLARPEIGRWNLLHIWRERLLMPWRRRFAVNQTERRSIFMQNEPLSAAAHGQSASSGLCRASTCTRRQMREHKQALSAFFYK